MKSIKANNCQMFSLLTTYPCHSDFFGHFKSRIPLKKVFDLLNGKSKFAWHILPLQTCGKCEKYPISVLRYISYFTSTLGKDLYPHQDTKLPILGNKLLVTSFSPALSTLKENQPVGYYVTKHIRYFWCTRQSNQLKSQQLTITCWPHSAGMQ